MCRILITRWQGLSPIGRGCRSLTWEAVMPSSHGSCFLLLCFLYELFSGSKPAGNIHQYVHHVRSFPWDIRGIRVGSLLGLPLRGHRLCNPPDLSFFLWEAWQRYMSETIECLAVSRWRTEWWVFQGISFINDRATTAVHCSSHGGDVLIGGSSPLISGLSVFGLPCFP